MIKIKEKDTKIINFLQDFGSAKLEHLQRLFDEYNNNFKNILSSNVISKKGDIFVHNTQKIDENMLVALDILCRYKGRFVTFHRGNFPIYISFLTKDNLLYHIIVADEGNKKGIIKLVNSPPYLPKSDRLILAFHDREDVEKITTDIPFLYCTYPGLDVINDEITEDEEICWILGLFVI